MCIFSVVVTWADYFRRNFERNAANSIISLILIDKLALRGQNLARCDAAIAERFGDVDAAYVLGSF